MVVLIDIIKNTGGRPKSDLNNKKTRTTRDNPVVTIYTDLEDPDGLPGLTAV